MDEVVERIEVHLTRPAPAASRNRRPGASGGAIPAPVNHR
jgi:hypothetical protein